MVKMAIRIKEVFASTLNGITAMIVVQNAKSPQLIAEHAFLTSFPRINLSIIQ